MDKLTKSFEALKVLQSTVTAAAEEKLRKKDTGISVKEKINHCNSIVEHLLSLPVKNHADYSKYFSQAFETVFLLYNDSDADVRLVADHSLNRLIKQTLMDSNATRVQVELYKELKKNGPARSLRAALMKFADLADHIKPQKARVFAVSLVSAVSAMVKRPEDSVQEGLVDFVEKVWPVLGRFFSDDETKVLIKVYLPNLQLQSLTARRSAASALVIISQHSRKPHQFCEYLFKAILEQIVPVQFDCPTQVILGCFFTVKQLLPVMKQLEFTTDSSTNTKTTPTGAVIKLANASVTLSDAEYLQLYEVLLYYCCHSNNSVASASLEALQQLLRNLPDKLLPLLLSPDGLQKTRIFPSDFNGSKQSSMLSRSRKGSFSTRSGVSSLAGSTSDLTTLALSVGDFNINPDDPIISVPSGDPLISEESRSDISDPKSSGVALSSDVTDDRDSAYGGMEIGELVADDVVEQFDDPLRSQSPAFSISPKKRNLKPLEVSTSQSLTLRDWSEPSTPLATNFPTADVISIPNGIGSFSDATVSLLYCGRLLAAKFLLMGIPGETIADRDVRVSQKSLAFGCLDALTTLNPSILMKELHVFNGSQLISDVFLYRTHSDPQLRASAISLICRFYTRASVEAQMNSMEAEVKCDDAKVLENWMKRCRCGIIVEEICIVETITSGLVDESAVVARATITGLASLWNCEVVQRQQPLMDLLRKSLNLAKNPYFLVKMDLAGFLTSLCYGDIQLQSKNFQADVIEIFLEVFLVDDDYRVRQTGCAALSRLIPQLYSGEMGVESLIAASVRCRMKDVEILADSNTLGRWSHDCLPIIHGLVEPYWSLTKETCDRHVEENLSVVIRLLFGRLSTATNKYSLTGYVSALAVLSDDYKPTVYRRAWLTAESKSIFGLSAGSDASGAGVLSWMMQLLVNGSYLHDFNFHSQMLRLTGNLLGGLVVSSIGPRPTEKWSLLNDSRLVEIVQECFLHYLRVLNLYWYVLTETIPTPIATGPLRQLQHLPQTPSLSPVKRRISGKSDSTSEGVTKGPDGQPNIPAAPLPAPKVKFGDCFTSPNFLRLMETIRSAYASYKISMDEGSSEKLLGLLTGCLTSLAQLLEIANLSDISTYVEELLLYLKASMTVAPIESILCVQQLLKSLFGTNLNFMAVKDTDESGGEGVNPSFIAAYFKVQDNSVKRPTYDSSLFESAVNHPYSVFAQTMATAANRHGFLSGKVQRHLGWLGLKSDKHVLAILRSGSGKAALTSFIRMFEPVVIQSLKLYTNITDVPLQTAIIHLLMQLIQVRVNYCLLDADFRFLQFVYSQLESVEEGLMVNAGPLIPVLFEFFVLLSYERYQGKTVLDIPKILQLCDGLLASGQNPAKNVIPALHVVALDLYLLRGAAKLEDPKDLEAQKEVVLSMILKLSCTEAVDILSFLLYQTKLDNEEKWRQLSRDVVDCLLPTIAKSQMEFNSIRAVHCVMRTIELCSPSAFRPVDSLLQSLLTSPTLYFIQANVSEESLVETARGYFSKRPKTFLNWLASQLLLLRTLILVAREDAILSRLDQMNITLNPNLDYKTPPQDILAKLISTVMELSILLLVSERQKDDFKGNWDLGNDLNSYRLLTQLVNEYSSLLLHTTVVESLKKVTSCLSANSIVWSPITVESGVLEKFLCRCEFADMQLLILQLQILAALKLFEVPLWRNQLLQSTNPMVKRTSLLLYCDHLKEIKSPDVFLSAVTPIFSLLVEMSDEQPVQQLFQTVNQWNSAGFVSLMSATLVKPDGHSATELRKLVQLGGFVPLRASGPLIEFLAEKLLTSSHLSVGRIANDFLMRRVELLLINRSEETMNSLNRESIGRILLVFNDKRIEQRYRHLNSLLITLQLNYYPDVVVAKVNPPASLFPGSKNKFNKSKFIQTVKTVIHRHSCEPDCMALLLSSLQMEEPSEILLTEGVTPAELLSCLQLAVAQFHENRLYGGDSNVTSPTGSSSSQSDELLIVDCSKFPLLCGAKEAILKYLRMVVVKHPFPENCVSLEDDNYRIDRSLLDDVCSNAYRNFGSCLTYFLRVSAWLRPFQLTDVKNLTNFMCNYAQVCLSNGCVTSAVTFLECLRQFLIFASGHDCFKTVSDACVLQQCNLIGCVHFICKNILKIPMFSEANPEPMPFQIPKDHSAIKNSWSHAAAMLRWVEMDSMEFKRTLPASLSQTLTAVIMGLSRLPVVNSVCRTPPDAFRYGWTPELKKLELAEPNSKLQLYQIPATPVHFLQNNLDVLKRFVRRVNTIGWVDRQQFEETWMALLGVLSSTPVGTELTSDSPQVIAERICGSKWAIRSMTSLLLQSLLTPKPGNPSVGSYLLRHRERNCAFLRTKFGRRLTALNAKINQTVRSFTHVSSTFHLRGDPPVFNGNIERFIDMGDYSLSQLSIETLWSITGILAEERKLLAESESAETPVSPIRPKSSPTDLPPPAPIVPTSSGIFTVPTSIAVAIRNRVLPSSTAGEKPPAKLDSLRLSEAREVVETPSNESAPPIGAILDPLSLAVLTEEQIDEDTFEVHIDDNLNIPTVLPLSQPTEEQSETTLVKRSASGFLLLADSGLDLVSSLHFLLDLYAHWLSNSPDNVPISLLSTTVESMVLLSDVFTERSQYDWLWTKLRLIYHARPPVEDEILLEFLVLGALKSAAVLSLEDLESKRFVVELLELGLQFPQLAVRISTLCGSLYLLQYNTADDLPGVLLPLLTDYVVKVLENCVNRQLTTDVVEKPQNLKHVLVVWSVGFRIIEAFRDDVTRSNFTEKFMELCVKFVEQPVISMPMYQSVLYGIQSFLVCCPSNRPFVSQLIRATSTKIASISDSRTTVPAIELLLTCLYVGKDSRPFDESQMEFDLGSLLPESHTNAMEKLSLFLNKIVKGDSEEAEVVGVILPYFLADYFNPSDVMNRVISELLSPAQTRPKIMAKVLFQVFETLREKETAFVVCDWALLSLPSFTNKTPVELAIWSLTGFLLSACTNGWVRSFFPVNLGRLGKAEPFDRDLFCFAVGSFRAQLEDSSQTESFLLTVKDAVRRYPDSFYQSALEVLINFQP